MAIAVLALLPIRTEAGRSVPEDRAEVQLSFAPLVKRVSPAVVNIYTKRTVQRAVSPFAGDPFFHHFFGDGFGFGGMQRERVESALGSGVIVEADGLIVTNAHVIKDAETITVALANGQEYEARKTLVDERSDLALLRLTEEGLDLPYVKLKPSETLEVGDLVLAIGNPFGVGQTVTSGIVSAVARSSLNINDFNFFIQTDAAINPGNSGGPLVAMDGSVVGINTAIFSRSGGSLGIGFAVPSEMVATVIAAEKSGTSGAHGVIRPWLGLTAQTVTSDIAESLNLNAPKGVLVASLHDQSPVKDAGIKQGDVIVAINGREIRDPSELKFRMATIPLGERAKFEYLRIGKKNAVKVKAIAPPNKPDRKDTVISGNNPFNGVTISNLNPAVATELGIADDENGVVIAQIAPRSHAARLMRVGEIIVAVNNIEVRSVDDLSGLLKRSNPRGWQIILSRDGQKRQLILR